MASSIPNPNANNKKEVLSSSLLLSGRGFDQTTSSTSTTFVQADPFTFRAVVQSLTGSTHLHPSTKKLPDTVRSAAKPNSVEMGPRRPGFKLHERRKSAKKLEIKLNNRVGSDGSPSAREFLGLGGDLTMVSPVSTLDIFARGSPISPVALEEEEERAIIAEKGFYLHPTPLTTPRGGSEPELLPLFPLHSPKC